MVKKQTKQQKKTIQSKIPLNKVNSIKIAKGAGIAILGALLTYVEELIPMIEFGEYTPIAVAINAVIVNVVRKMIIS